MTEIQRLTQTILVLILSLDINRVWGASEVDKHLEMGKKFLQEGNLADALNHYNMAVDGDPSNYLTYFKRAAVFLALGQSKRALPDLDKVLELKPDFHQARSERASTNLKLGKLQLASDDYHKISSTGTSLSEEAKSILTKIEEVRLYMDEVDSFLEMGAFDEAIARLQISVELCPWDAKLRQKRADCFEKVGQYQSAISDIKMLTKLIPDNTQGFLRVSKLYYQMGEIEDSLKEIRECLKLDPDHKECYPLYKKVKKLNKQLSNAQKDMDEERYDEGLQTLDSALRTETEVLEIVKQIKRMICECHTKLKNVEIGIEKCDEAFEADPQNVNLLCDKAELYIVNEQYEEAIKIYQEASNIDNHYQRVCPFY
jgi:DnaJ family protein C protein 3